MYDFETELTLEKCNDKHLGICVRGVIWEIDPDTGAKSVLDIIQTTAPKILARILSAYIDNSTKIIGDFNYGKAVKLESRLLKAAQQTLG